MKLTELFSLEELEIMLQDGYVKETKHPTLPLTILNYTDKTTYEQRWNPATTHCRGLIVNNVTHEVIARGPRKFFNYGEPSAPMYHLSTPVAVTRKEDGSLGIGWFFEGTHGVATRGSFQSEQAAHATELLTEDDKANIVWADGNYSRIWEIVYPENRIVLDYGERDEIIRLGSVNNQTGLIQWRPRPDLSMGHITLAEAIAWPIPDDEEGYVLDILDQHGEVIDHLKLKGDKYKELHSAIFGLTERKVYDAWVAGTESSLIEELPDELQPWALKVAKRFDLEWTTLRNEITVAFLYVPVAPRKEQAQHILTNHKELAPALFALLDSNPEKCNAWVAKQVKPGHVPFRIEKETVSL